MAIKVLFPTKSPKVRAKMERGQGGPSAPTVRVRFLRGEPFYDRQGRRFTIEDFSHKQHVKLRTRHGSLTIRKGDYVKEPIVAA